MRVVRQLGGVSLLIALAGCSGLDQQAAAPSLGPASDLRPRLSAASVVDNVTVALQPGWNAVGF